MLIVQICGAIAFLLIGTNHTVHDRQKRRSSGGGNVSLLFVITI